MFLTFSKKSKDEPSVTTPSSKSRSTTTSNSIPTISREKQKMPLGRKPSVATTPTTATASTTTPESKTLEEEIIDAPFREFSKLEDIEIQDEEANKTEEEGIVEDFDDDRRTRLPPSKQRMQLPRPIEDPPEAVKGQLLRFWKNDGSSDHKHHHQHHQHSQDQQQDVEDFGHNGDSKKPAVVEELNLQKEFELPESLMTSLLELMESGDITKEDLIETLINSGVLPVEVTKLGKIPIVVGVTDDGERKVELTAEVETGPEDFGRLRQRQRQREPLSTERLRELGRNRAKPFDERRRQRPPFRGRNPSSPLVDVDTSDPDFEFEQFAVSTPGKQFFSFKMYVNSEKKNH